MTDVIVEQVLNVKGPIKRIIVKNIFFKAESTVLEEEYISENSEDEVKSETQNKFEFSRDDLQFWANKKHTSEAKTEFSIEDLKTAVKHI